MKKILCLFLVFFTLSLQAPMGVFAEKINPTYTYQRVLVMQTPYNKYVEELERSFPLLHSEKLVEIYERFSGMTTEDTDTQALVDFIKILAEHELSLREVQDVMLDKETITESLSEEEQALAQKELQTLQNTLHDEALHFLENAMISFEQMQNYEQSGDFDMNIDMDIPDYFGYSFGLNLDDYISQMQGFDSRIETDFDLNFTMDSSYESFDGGVNGNIEVITLGGDIYLKAGDISLNASEMVEEEFGDIIDKLNELGENNTYLHYNDISSEMIIEILQNISSSKLEHEMQEIKDTIFFEAYRKKDTSYLVRPTKEFCSFMKQSLHIFDPFGGDTCSQNQYEDMLDDMQEEGFTLLLTPGKNSTLSFQMDNSTVKGSIDLHYNSYGLISFSGDFYEPYNKDKNHIQFEYLPNETLYFTLKIEGMMTDGNLEMNNKGVIEKADISLNYKNYGDTFDGSLIYNRGDITTNLSGDMGGALISCVGSGNLTRKTGDFTGTCSLEDTNYNGETEMYEMSLDTDYDLSGERNNVSFDMNFGSEENMSFSLDFHNTGSKKKIHDVTITVPEKTQDADTFLYGESTSNFSDPYVTDYEIETQEFDDYTQTCYMYDNGDTTCYDDYETKTITCNYTAETDIEECSTYDFGYTVEENEFPEYTQTCYIYNSGEKSCSNYYDDKTEYCYDYSATTGESYCSTQTDDYYYDGFSDVYYYDDYEIDGKTGEKTFY